MSLVAHNKLKHIISMNRYVEKKTYKARETTDEHDLRQTLLANTVGRGERAWAAANHVRRSYPRERRRQKMPPRASQAE